MASPRPFGQTDTEHLRVLLSVLDHATDAVLITEAEPIDQPGPRILYANAAFTRMTGYAPDELLGQTPRILQGPRSDRRTLDRLRAALQAWERVEVELVNYHKDGSEFWVELSIAPVANERGWYTHWIAIQRDITARKRSVEQRARDRAEVLELSAQGVPLGEVLGRLRGAAQVLWDDLPTRIELSTLETSTLETPQGSSAVPESVQVQGGGERWRHPILSATGRTLGMVVVAAGRPATADDHAQLSSVAGLAALLIERDQTRLALQEALRRAEVLAALGDVLQQALKPEEVADWSLRQLGPALGAQSMLMIRVEGEHLHPPAFWGNVPDAVQRIMTRPGLTLADAPALRTVAGQGHGLYVENYQEVPGALPDLPPLAYGVEPLCTPDGTLRGFLMAWKPSGGWPESERTLLQRAAQTLGLALERAEGQAQIEAQRGQLTRQNAELGAANEELKALTYSASHDLMTPVRHVRSFAELTRKALVLTPNEKASAHLDRVEMAADRMSTMIGALLQLSRSARRPLKREAVALARVVEQVRETLEPSCSGRDVKWNVTELSVVTGDAEALREALTHLLANAIKFTTPRERAVIEVWSEERPDGWEVSVRDNGVGFDPEYTARLFGAFQRLHTQREFEGVGIGLATVRRIVLRHGGAVSARGTPGQGATFAFTLPRVP